MDEEQCGMYDPDEDDEFDQEMQQATGELTESKKEMIRRYYTQFDIDKSQTLSFNELRKCLQFVGLNPTAKQVKDIIKKHGQRKVTYEVWEEIFKEELLSQIDPAVDLLEAFRMFDRDKTGTLDRDELYRCMTTVSDDKLTEEECNEMFDMLDTNGNGTLDLMVFEAITFLTKVGADAIYDMGDDQRGRNSRPAHSL